MYLTDTFVFCALSCRTWAHLGHIPVWPHWLAANKKAKGRQARTRTHTAHRTAHTPPHAQTAALRDEFGRQVTVTYIKIGNNIFGFVLNTHTNTHRQKVAKLRYKRQQKLFWLKPNFMCECVYASVCVGACDSCRHFILWYVPKPRAIKRGFPPTPLSSISLPTLQANLIGLGSSFRRLSYQQANCHWLWPTSDDNKSNNNISKNNWQL